MNMPPRLSDIVRLDSSDEENKVKSVRFEEYVEKENCNGNANDVSREEGKRSLQRKNSFQIHDENKQCMFEKFRKESTSTNVTMARERFKSVNGW